MLVIGGAAESLDARPGNLDLVLKHRKGFVKVAVLHGAALVPVLGLGENDLFSAVPNHRGSKLRRFQEQLQKMLGVGLPLLCGRGVFNYSFGALPHRRPIVVLVGAPIPVPPKGSISEESEESQSVVDKVHCEYMVALEALYDEYKVLYTQETGDDVLPLNMF